METPLQISSGGLSPTAPGASLELRDPLGAGGAGEGAAVPRAAEAGEARPVDAGERVALLDVLRGFALGGVFLSNLYLWFSGRIFFPQERARASVASTLDAAVNHAVSFLVFGKFVTIFSFLFGLGFSIQMRRAEQRGAQGGRLYARRLFIMLLLGVAHLCLIWYGDILHLYALIGFSLLLWRGRSERTLLLWGFLCAAVIPAAIALAEQFLPLLWTSADALEASRKADAERMLGPRAHSLATFQAGSYLAVIRENPVVFWRMSGNIGMSGFFVGVLGRFLLGFYVGRRGLLHDVAAHRPLFRRLLGWGLALGVIGNGYMLVMRLLFLSGRITQSSLVPRILNPVMREVGVLGLALFYVAAVALLFQRARFQRLLSVLAPVGQMALTNYLSQSVISVLVFYGIGLGLIGEVRPALLVPLMMGIFVVQIAWSHLWLSRFRFGPAEWAWRSLTYGKAQPMRRRG